VTELSLLNIIFLVIFLGLSGYFAGISGMPLGPIRIFIMIFLGVPTLIVFGTNLAISFVVMAATVWNNYRAQRIDFKLGGSFLLFGFIGALFGGLFSEVLPKELLLWIVTVLIFISAFLIVQTVHFPVKDESHKELSPKSPVRKNIIAGALNFVIGVLGGSVGMVLGALRYPVMINYLKTEAKAASATNSFINLMVAMFAFLGHIIISEMSGNRHFDLMLFLPLGIVSAIGSYLGSKHVGNFSQRFILKTLYMLLFIMGVLMIFRDLI